MLSLEPAVHFPVMGVWGTSTLRVWSVHFSSFHSGIDCSFNDILYRHAASARVCTLCEG